MSKQSKNWPKFSCLMPTYNRADLLAESIQSVIGQKYKNWELIVVDDGSTDSTKDLMKYFTTLDSRIKYFHCKHSGISKTRNYAVSQATGDILVCADSDDWNHPLRLQIIAKEFRKKKTMDIFYSGWDICDQDLNMIMKRQPAVFNPHALLKAQYIAQPTLAFKKEVAKKVKYNEKLQAGEDWEWLLECAVRKFKFGWSLYPLVKYRMHIDSVSIQKKKEVDDYDKKMLNKFKPLIEKTYGTKK